MQKNQKNLMVGGMRTFVTDGQTSKGMETLDKRSVQLIPANGKQSDNKGQTSSATVMSRSGKLSEHLLASTKPREIETKEQLANDTCCCG